MPAVATKRTKVLDVIKLREQDGLTFQKIAEVMGYSNRERARQNYWKAKRHAGRSH